MDIKINLDGLTFGDLEQFERWNNGSVPLSDILDTLDRIVDGGARRLPISVMGELTEAINQAVSGAQNPKN